MTSRIGSRTDWAAAMPGLAQFRGYQRSWLRGDVMAGLTVVAYLVPQAMAYATVAGLSPVAGLWASLLPLAIYAVMGSSRYLSAGPESSTALMTAAALAPLAAGNSGRYAMLAAVLAVLVGVVCFAGGLLRLGFIADLLSRPVLIGYMAGVALIMIGGQLGKLTGTPPIRYPGSRPHACRIQASNDAVVVFPWVPATASTQRPDSTCSASHWGPDTYGRRASKMASIRGLPRETTFPMTQISGLSDSWAGSNPSIRSIPSARS